MPAREPGNNPSRTSSCSQKTMCPPHKTQAARLALAGLALVVPAWRVAPCHAQRWPTSLPGALWPQHRAEALEPAALPTSLTAPQHTASRGPAGADGREGGSFRGLLLKTQASALCGWEGGGSRGGRKKQEGEEGPRAQVPLGQAGWAGQAAAEPRRRTGAAVRLRPHGQL